MHRLASGHLLGKLDAVSECQYPYLFPSNAVVQILPLDLASDGGLLACVARMPVSRDGAPRIYGETSCERMEAGYRDRGSGLSLLAALKFESLKMRFGLGNARTFAKSWHRVRG